MKDKSKASHTVSQRPSRREFLAIGGKVAAGSAVLAGVAIPRVHAAEDNTIKLALVGCGNRGTGAVGNAFSTTGGPVKLYAMADLFENRLTGSYGRLTEAFKDNVDVPADRRFVGFDAYKKAIDCVGPGGVVLLTTHAAFRPMMFEYAVKQGVNVFAEKSFATDAPAARRWLKAAEESEKKNLKVGAGFMWRHSKARQEVIRRIHDGEIGDVNTLRIYRNQGSAGCPTRPNSGSEIGLQIRRASMFTWASSGIFSELHSHNVDIACWAKGAWPVSAQGFGGRCYARAGNQFDHYAIEYTFADGAKLFDFCRTISGCWATYSDYAHGSKGSARIMASLGDPKPEIYKSQKMVKDQVVWAYGKRDSSPYVAEWQALLDAVRQDKPHNEGRRAGEAQIATIMGRAATHTGQLLTWEETFNSDFQFIKDIDNISFDTPAPVQAGPDGIYPACQPGLSKEEV